jgi:hypothetical protein
MIMDWAKCSLAASNKISSEVPIEPALEALRSANSVRNSSFRDSLHLLRLNVGLLAASLLAPTLSLRDHAANAPSAIQKPNAPVIQTWLSLASLTFSWSTLL